VVTGYPTIDTAKEAIKLGANDYLTKPTDPEDVIRATGEAMNHKYWALQREPQHLTDMRALAGANSACAN
jgi:ActR/RegA family two-component response regulator